MNLRQEGQGALDQKLQVQIKQEYWQKWIEWVQFVKIERYQAVKVLQFQTQKQQRLVSRVFKKLLQMHQEQKFSQLLKFKNQILQQQMQQQQKDRHIQFKNLQSENQDQKKEPKHAKINLAQRFYKRKTYAKSIRAWIQYIIQCKNFQHNISMAYLKYILRKYFDIINDFKFKSRQKKARKAQTALQNSPQKQGISPINAQSQINFINPANLINQIDRFSHTAQKFTEVLNRNPGYKRNQPPQPQSSSFYGEFQRNPILNESRRSQFSSISAQLDYQSKRRFRPITQLPSIPDLQKTPTQLNKQTLSSDRLNKQRIPTKVNQSEVRQFQAPKHSQNLQQSVSESNLSAIPTQQNQTKAKILQLIIKQKLVTLAIMSGQQFQDGLEFDNYRQKTINTLKKLRQIS